MENLDGFENISGSIHGIFINGNPLLSNLDGLQEITSINLLEIEFNDSLNNFEGLNGLTQINSRLKIVNNPVLTNLSGLNNVNNIGGSNVSHIYIYGNPVLSDYCGISNAIINGNFSGNYEVSLNLYNPSLQDLLNGNCN